MAFFRFLFLRESRALAFSIFRHPPPMSEEGATRRDDGRDGLSRPVRGAVALAISILLAVAITYHVSARGAALGRSTPGKAMAAELLEFDEGSSGTVVPSGSLRPQKLSFTERFMQRLANLADGKLTDAEKANLTSCGDGNAECVPAEAVRTSAMKAVHNLADNWVFRNPHDMHPWSFCAEFTDLTAKELRACLRHLMKPIELARAETIPRNGTNASLEQALAHNVTFNVSDESGWDACYEAFEDHNDKRTCLAFVTEKLQGDIAFACSELDTEKQRLRCKHVELAVGNVKKLIMRQQVIPGRANATKAEEESRRAYVAEMRAEEEKTEAALSAMNPELQKMLNTTIQVSDESNAALSTMEQAINATIGSETPEQRLGAMPGPFGELPGQMEHEYMASKIAVANESVAQPAEEEAKADEPESEATQPVSVDQTASEMQSMIARGYNGPGDLQRALRLMHKAKEATPVAHAAAGVAAKGDVGKASRELAQHARHTQTLMQVGGGMQVSPGRRTSPGTSLSARLQGLAQLEKLATHGNLGGLDAMMDSSGSSARLASIAAKQADDARIAEAFSQDGTRILRDTHSLSSGMDTGHSVLGLDLASIMSGKQDDGMDFSGAMPSSPQMRAATAVATGFNDDSRVVSKIASSWARDIPTAGAAPQKTFDTSFKHVYNKIEADDNRPTGGHVRSAISKWARRMHHDSGAGEGQIPAKRAGRHRPVATREKPDQGEEAIDKLWNKLLTEEALAKAEKHEAAVASDKASIAAHELEAREAAKSKAAQEAIRAAQQAKIKADRTAARSEERAEAHEKRKADRTAHELAKYKYAQMQLAKRSKSAASHDSVASQPSAHAQAPQPNVVEAEPISGAPSPAKTDGSEEDMIVETVQHLMKMAKSEPVMTSAERSEQQAEVWKAKQLLQEAAALKRQRALRLRQQRRRRQAEEERQEKKTEEAHQQRQVWRQAQEEHEGKEHRRARQQRKEGEKRQHQTAEAKDKQARVRAHRRRQQQGARQQEAVRAEVMRAMGQRPAAAEPARQQTQQTLPEPASQQAAGSPARAHAEAQTPATVRERIGAAVPGEHPKQIVKAVAGGLKPRPPHAQPAQQRKQDEAGEMEATMQKEHAAEEAKVKALVKSLQGSDSDSDGESDSMGGDDGLLKALLGQDQSQDAMFSEAQHNIASEVHSQTKTANDGDGSNLGDLISIMSAPPPPPPPVSLPSLTGEISAEQKRHKQLLAKEKKLMAVAMGGGGKSVKANSVTAEAKEIHDMSAKEDEEIKKMPGANAMKQLKDIDAKLEKGRSSLKAHLQKEKIYKAQAAAARKHMAALEKDNSGMFGLIGALESAGSAGGQLGAIIANSMSSAKSNGKLPNVQKEFSAVWNANSASDGAAAGRTPAVSAAPAAPADPLLAEAAEAKRQAEKDEEETAHLPGANAMKKLKALDAKIASARKDMATHVHNFKKYKAAGETARKKMQGLEDDDGAMFDLVSTLSTAGSAGGKLGKMLSGALDQATPSVPR